MSNRAFLRRTEVFFRFSRGRKQVHFRTAVIAAYGLRVISAGPGAVVFLCTRPAHGKHLHAGPLPVIRQGIKDGHPGTAAGAVDKGMQIAAVRRIIKLSLTFLADGNIR